MRMFVRPGMSLDLEAADKALPVGGLCALVKGKLDQARNDVPAVIGDLERPVRIEAQLSEGWYRLVLLYAGVTRAELTPLKVATLFLLNFVYGITQEYLEPRGNSETGVSIDRYAGSLKDSDPLVTHGTLIERGSCIMQGHWEGEALRVFQ
jgi:hypothetical protein